VNKAELIKEIAQKAGIAVSDARRGLDTTLMIIIGTVKKGEKLTLSGFGTFEAAARKERQVRNPMSGKKITIAARKVPKFKPGKILREAVNL